jgi:glycosyltransferase involved in cell wall biosynthesis
MRVALVIAGPYPALRGSQVLVSHLARGLAARDHDVRVVTYGERRGLRPGPRPARVLLDAVLVARLWRVARRARVDVIHAHNYEAAIAGLLVGRTLGLPTVYHGHSALEQELPTYVAGPAVRRGMARLGRLLDAQVPRRADFCIAVTEDLGAHLRRTGVRDRSLACIEPAGAPDELAGSRSAAPEPGLVCYAGNLDGYQNLDFLLRSFTLVRAAVPGTRLVLVTHADARVHTARLVEAGLPPDVDIVQAASYEEVRDRLGAATVAVCPRAERSGFPMKLLNYMAAGKAIVACAGSAKGLLDGVTARVVGDEDTAGFADAVVSLLRDPAARARLGAAARRAVESRDAWEKVLDRVESIYRQVVAGAPRVLRPVAARSDA